MRRPTLALSLSLTAIGLSASIAMAQQLSQSPASNGAAPSSADSIDPSMAARPTRYLLRNGMDYLAYREYARSLSFFRAVEARQNELSASELVALKKGIAQAQQGMREAVNGPRVVTRAKGRATTPPGSFALAKPPGQLLGPSAPTDPIQLASAEMPSPPPITRSAAYGPTLPAPVAVEVAMPAPAVAASSAPVFGSRATAPAAPSNGVIELPSPPEAVPVALPDPSTGPTSVIPESTPAQAPAALPTIPEPASAPPTLPAPTTDPQAQPVQAAMPVELPPATPATGPSPQPTEPPAPLVLESTTPSTTPVELPPVPSPTPVEPAQEPATAPASGLPSLPEVVPTRVAEASQRPDSSTPPQPSSLPDSPPTPEAPPAAEAPSAADRNSLPTIPVPTPVQAPAPVQASAPAEMSDSILAPHLRREVEQIAQRAPGEGRIPGPGGTDATDALSPPSQGSTRLELPRAPSPTEARPLRRIPVPEEFVPLGKREWDPNRKYWAAAGTCHMILYFQDPVLERYGQSVEQSLGPIGRYFSYPLDDPKQSNQRNQILQPFYSMGKFCFQVGTLPYKLVVDPPWEAEYDLGYYRPGDRIPADTIMITPYGVGPPLKGWKY